MTYWRHDPQQIFDLDLTDFIPPTPAWFTEAACRGRSDVSWFPRKGDQALEARAICATCPVQPDCLAAGIEGRERGLWGGLSETERRRSRLAA